ncbi:MULTISPECIES: GNAT family N-acetyltransferase [unclassified Modicisalibacter]|uniref:tRNA(Met) cytidine acetyltransferase TmcA n=1 Tax=unclassified Modicisalibacter TaxID=2679913 RepID=UPI001CCABB29|nr:MULTISPECIES: GNAT family N-acetyltransferase [unclassified Modicisalibacter]MBZ9559166.1 tRNA(Met) cytidine acetyltransferase [Modicisalibacter sp. R2A 31.J]MBZ9576669.1 tRNA(Met) cytidine acetyltransferase [Modicisalibacter sp. MOD 31.J]
MHASLTESLASLRHCLVARRHRALLWVDGEPAEAVARGLALWRAGDWRDPLWLGPASPDAGIAALPAAKARTRLGGEHDLVVIDGVSATGGFDPDAFGAVSGTVRAGGLLVLLTPRAWREGVPCPDADYARLAAWPHARESLPARTLGRLARQLAASPLTLHWPAAAALPTLALPAAPAFAPSPVEDADCLTADQAQAVRRLERLRRRRPLVISADRGRGKSAALGIAAARRLAAGESELWLTAPRSAAVEPVFARLAALLPEGRREGQAFSVDTSRGVSVLRFLAPDAVEPALAGPGVDPRSPPTLFVDEAAAIPAPLLGRWLAAFPRLAFATTVHGYEGTGRGFAVRFRARLDRDTPDWRACSLDAPVRWAPNDPLEALTRNLLLLDAEPATDADVAAALARGDGLRYRTLDRAALAGDERRLAELFGLLVQAHYRTTPGDLRQLLDAPDVHVLTADVAGHCVGVCLAQAEGGFPRDLAEAVRLGRRRPRGHLLAQSLAAHGGWREAAEARWWRIQRIAVHPAARRRGIATRLVATLAARAHDAGIDQLGVSYGAEPTLLTFWRAQGFVSLRLGLSREAASGEHALMMGRALHAAAEARLSEWRDDFQRLLPSLLGTVLAALPPRLVTRLLDEAPVPALDAATRERTAWFAAGGGELALVRPWLARAFRIVRHQSPRTLSDKAWDDLVAPLFLGRDAPAGDEGGAGRKARLQHRRELAARLSEALEARHREPR